MSMVKTPPYDLILGHERADVLLEVLPEGSRPPVQRQQQQQQGRSGGADGDNNDDIDKYEDDDEEERSEVACLLVCIRPNKDARHNFPVWFWWELSKVIIMEDDENYNSSIDIDGTIDEGNNDGSIHGGNYNGEWKVDALYLSLSGLNSLSL